LSRWISVDPILGSYLSGKPAGGVYNSINLNLYHYAGLNPIKYIDPTGMFKDESECISSSKAGLQQKEYFSKGTVTEGDSLWGIARYQLLKESNGRASISNNFNANIMARVSYIRKQNQLMSDKLMPGQKLDTGYRQNIISEGAVDSWGSHDIPLLAGALAAKGAVAYGLGAAGKAIMTTEIGLKASFTAGMAFQLAKSRAGDAIVRGTNFLLQHPVEVNQFISSLISGAGPPSSSVPASYSEIFGEITGRAATAMYPPLQETMQGR